MTTDALLSALRAVHAALDAMAQPHALVGGLAVSVRAMPRLTRDVDIAVAVSSDADAESVVRRLRALGYEVAALVEQDLTGRLATARMVAPDRILVDLLFASSGIEPEVVGRATPVEIDAGLEVPVARAEELVAMKVLAMRPRREQDTLDARHLLEVEPTLDLEAVRDNLRLIRERGFDRGEPLEEKLGALLAERTG